MQLGTDILYVVDRYPELSQTFVHDEICELRHQGVGITVAALRAGDHPGDPGSADYILSEWSKIGSALESAAFLAEHPMRLARLILLVIRMRLAYSRQAFLILPKLAGRIEASGAPTRVHTHFAWGASSVAAYLATLLDRPSSITVHARDLYLGAKNLGAKLSSVDLVVTVCDFNKRWLAERGYNLDSVEVVPCGVGLPISTFEASERLVIGVGRLVAKKGFDLLIRATAIAKDYFPDMRVVIIGDGPERIRLESLIIELDLEEFVHLQGSMQHHEALEALARSSLFVLPCRIDEKGDSDAMPVVIREAMARAIPVISTPVAGIPETVTNDVGWITPVEDVDKLAEVICEALSDEAVARIKGAAGRRRVADKFTISQSVKTLRDVFQRSEQRYADVTEAVHD